MGKNILIRADASLAIGTGHVMRCLTLANAAKRKGWNICFLVRDPSENITNLIRDAGHQVWKLLSSPLNKKHSFNFLDHGDWLTVSQVDDAQETLDAIRGFKPDWVVVDHYALDATWYEHIKGNCAKILVIDDLGDRKFICDMLLDQNLDANAMKYDGKLSINCRLLLGIDFSLLKSEFQGVCIDSCSWRIIPTHKYSL